MGIEQTDGKVFTTNSRGEQLIVARGFVDFGVLLDSLEKLLPDLGKDKASRYKRIISATSDQVWRLAIEGGAMTSSGNIVAFAKDSPDVIDSIVSAEKTDRQIIVRSGVSVERAADKVGAELFLNPHESVLVIKPGAAQHLGCRVTRGGGFDPEFVEEKGFAGHYQAGRFVEAVARRFRKVYEETGIPILGVISHETVANQLVINIAMKSGRGLLRDARKWED